ncbi:antiviral innate immune response receptor RIG-I-like isoform X1 [Ptychodera flava]|uniref:antiviral innate immune response receptor RIG-I-like isoform X1 n=1 Tax=Ptychodera flava TaxID=63121 RepID=UPI003969DB18
MEHILKICANLDADNISTVVKNKNELQRYAPVPDEALLSVQGRVEDPFFKIVSGIMSKIETDMLSSEGTDAIDPKVLKPPSERGTQSYEHWVVNLGKQSVVVLTDNKIGRMFVTCTDHLRKYNDSLFVNKDARTKDALQYLNKYFDNLENKRQGFDKLDEDLFRLFKENKPELEKVVADPQYKNPVLEKLGDLILKAYKDKPDSRCIILTTTRASCYALKSWMEETPEFAGLNPGVLIGGGGSGDNPGMTETQQRNLLEKFKEGNHSIIVCTSVGQEGIDIQLCNLVFRYNYANNEIGRVQAIGRSRAKSGKTVLVAGKETGIVKREQLNMMRENMMYKAIQEIRRMSERSFANKISEFQASDQVERRGREEAKTAVINKRRKEAPKEAVKFNCKRCKTFACLSTDLRIFKESHYLLIDDTFQERIKISQHRKPKQIDEMYKHKKVHCKKCMQDWGIIATIQDVDYHILKVESFVLVMPDGKQRLCRKWEDITFNVEHCSKEDLQKKINVEESSSQN